DVRVKIAIGPKEAASTITYRSDAAGEVRVLRERMAPLRGSAQRPGREPLAFDVPDDATAANPLLVELGVPDVTPVQVVITSDRPVRGVFCSMSRRDVAGSSITLRQDPGTPVTSLRGEVPPGPYRLYLGPAHDPEGSDRFMARHTQDVTVGNQPVQLPVRVQHGGRIRVTVTAKDERHVPGTIRLRDGAGVETRPGMYSPGRGGGQSGELWAPGPLWTNSILAPGRYEVILDLPPHGEHRQWVDVRACEFADVAVQLR
ncbi:MAG TPA: hypothetical protein VFT55_08285, partial [Planctomycetota bacterium]|nr:hypothetical protein [Planctomycetota bacterium]